jgi:copper chaperone NosL
MAYQPPLIGYEQLLNFGAYSIPDLGGWIFVAVGVVLVGVAVLEWRKGHKVRRLYSGAGAPVLVALAVVVALSSCGSGLQAIRYGQDNCDFCKMAFTDRHFGGEVISKKGKVYKFDDVHCLVTSLKTGVPAAGDVAGIYLVDYNGGPWIKAADAFLLYSENFHTPMNGNIAAFADAAARDAQIIHSEGKAFTWKELYP